MPMYEFKCGNMHCKEVFEKIVKSDVVQVSCPKCGEMSSKQISAPGGFLFKRDGWYKPSHSSGMD